MGHYPQWGIIDAGINKYPSTEPRFSKTQEPAFLNARTNNASGIREMEEFDITNLAAPSADRWNPRTWRRALCAPVGAPGFRGCGKTFILCARFSSEGFALALGSRGTALTKSSPGCALAFGRVELFIFNSLAARINPCPDTIVYFFFPV